MIEILGVMRLSMLFRIGCGIQAPCILGQAVVREDAALFPFMGQRDRAGEHEPALFSRETNLILFLVILKFVLQKNEPSNTIILH